MRRALIRTLFIAESEAITPQDALRNPGSARQFTPVDAMLTLRSADRRNYAVVKFRNVLSLVAFFDFLILR